MQNKAHMRRAGHRLAGCLMVTAALFPLQASAQLAGEGAPVPDVHFHPAEPRCFPLTLTGRF